MDIVKYKKLKNSKYQLILSNDQKVELYEDVILKYNLLLNKKIDINDQEIFLYNMECEVYYIALKYIKTRTRSKKEIIDKLKKDNYPEELIEKAINKLEEQGYINEEFFATSYLNNKLITTTNGPYKIRKDLKDKGIDDQIINKVLSEYNEEIQIEKISKVVNRMIKSNRSRGNLMLKRKIVIDLVNQGFDKILVERIINDTSFKDDTDIAKKEYDKLYKKLSKKYSGKELELKIKQKMYQKGLKYE